MGVRKSVWVPLHFLHVQRGFGRLVSVLHMGILAKYMSTRASLMTLFLLIA